MAECGLTDNKSYELKLGSSFRSRKENAFHTVRYDFKPASVDTSKPSELMVGKNNDITVVLPHVQESGSTTFKGSKRPGGKECILIIDKSTGVITLEKINSNVQLKKIRSSSGTSSMNKQATLSPIRTPKMPSKVNSGKLKVARQLNGDPSGNKGSGDLIKTTNSSTRPISQHIPSKDISNVVSELKESASESSSSDSDSDSDSDGDEVDLQEQGEALQSTLNSMEPEPEEKSQPFASSLHEDLQLTESESDSE